jgi:prepilin-type N-terminal cleavage/methylation domain-containing protein
MRKNNMNRLYLKSKGFTLVEIMIVVAIIALLAAIAIPNLLRAKMSSNDALAKSTLRAISTSCESFATSNSGNYPADETSLTGATPAYLNKSYCGQTLSGYLFTCNFGNPTYDIVAEPVTVGTSGTTTYTISTGGVLVP